MDDNLKKTGNRRDWLSGLSEFSERYIPDSFPIVLVLTLLVAAGALFLTDATPEMILNGWYDGFWSMLLFTMQVCLLMLTGYMVADSHLVRRVLIVAARYPKTVKQALILFIVVIAVLQYIHFALGLAGAVMFGKALLVEQEKKGQHIPVNMLAAIGCFTLMFQGGPTAGSPLLVASQGHFMESVIGIIPLTESTLAVPMIVMNLTLLIVFVIIFPLLAQKSRESVLDRDKLKQFTAEMQEQPMADMGTMTFSQKMDNSRLAQIIISCAGLLAFALEVFRSGINAIDINGINFFFLMLALILHGSPERVVQSARRGIVTISGVILQYPFYAGVFGILSHTGLGEVISLWFIGIAQPRFYTFFVFVFSALLNFVAAGGVSQFIIEAPYIMPAAIKTGVSTAYVLNAFTMGDLITNVILPFWAIPVLTAYGLKFRNIFPYCLIACAAGFIVIGSFFLLWMY